MMSAVLERTCWRGLQVDHPSDWELSIASGPDESGRCTFVDRRYQRLDIQWRPLKYLPNLDIMLDKYRRKYEDPTIKALTGLPPQWRGILRKTPDGLIVHAGTFFKSTRWLVEATIVWPGRRDGGIEDAVLRSLAPQDDADKVRLWQAMGMSVRIDRGYDLAASKAKVGRVEWHFTGKGKGRPEVVVERIAMAEHWLKGSLDEWLVDQLPRGVLPTGKITDWPAAPHSARQLISSSKIGTLASLRGLTRAQIDVAWQCPRDGRVYRLSHSRSCKKSELIALPAGLAVACCRPPGTGGDV